MRRVSRNHLNVAGIYPVSYIHVEQPATPKKHFSQHGRGKRQDNRFLQLLEHKLSELQTVS